MAELEPGQRSPSVVRADAARSSTGANKAPVVGYLRIRQSGAVDADGRIALDLGTVPSAVDWFIERVSIKCNSAVQTTFDMYEDMESDLYRLEHSPVGNDNIADYAAPVWVPNSTNLIAIWSGVSAEDSNGEPSVAQITAQIRTVT